MPLDDPKDRAGSPEQRSPRPVEPEPEPAPPPPAPSGRWRFIESEQRWAFVPVEPD